MKAVASDGHGAPRLVDFAEPGESAGLTALDVRAAALTNLDVAVASGRHYLSPSEGQVSVVGREAVVSSPHGGRLFLTARAIAPPFGSMAERTLADLDLGLPVPDGVPDDLAAALGNAGLAAWLPLSWRARLVKGETVLVLGATGVTGRIAVTVAKILGAGRVVAVGRDVAVLKRLLEAGADEILRLDDELSPGYWKNAGGGIDIVLDYLNGPPAEAVLEAMAPGGRMVQIGSPVGSGIMLPAQIMRQASLDVMGFAYYHAPVDEMRSAYAALCVAAMDGKIALARHALPLDRFAEAWSAQKSGGSVRHVLLP